MRPICIASKGRAGESKTISRLIEERVPFHMFIEPDEHAKYRTAYEGCEVTWFMHVLPENDRGISFVRQFILDYARAQDWPWFWMMDDDIGQTYQVVGGRCLKLSMKQTLEQAEDVITTRPDVAMGSLEYQQYAWSAKKPVKYNSYCDVAVLINVERTKFISYRPDCKEDRDFVLQALAIGFRSMRTCWLAFSAPKNGSNKGGLHDAYKAGLENHWSQRMVELWPGVCHLHTKADGRPDVKIDWKQFKIEKTEP
jgi:hypothetical protein